LIRKILAIGPLMIGLACVDRVEAACDTSTWTGTPCAPVAPMQYALPAGALVVANYSQLAGAVAGTTARDIILEDGTYSGGTLSFYVGHRLWARHVGGAVLTFGIHIEGLGAGIHGVKFALNGSSSFPWNVKAAIHTGAGNYGRVGDKVSITDTWIDGGNAAERGVYAQSVNGLNIQRVVLKNLRLDGIRVQTYGSTPVYPNPPIAIGDVDVSYVKDPGGLNNGTAEFGIMVGNSSAGSVIERVNCHHVDWSCIIAAGNAVNGLTVSDVWLDYTNDRAFYAEHYTSDMVLKRFLIGPHVMSGFNIEGAQAVWGWKPSGKNYKIFDGTFDTTRNGASVEPCNGPIDFQRVKFLHQCQYGLINDTNIPYNAGHCLPVGPFTQSNNNFSGMQSTAQPVGVNVPAYGNICGGYKPW
jgi:hypothetical protein